MMDNSTLCLKSEDKSAFDDLTYDTEILLMKPVQYTCYDLLPETLKTLNLRGSQQLQIKLIKLRTCNFDNIYLIRAYK